MLRRPTSITHVDPGGFIDQMPRFLMPDETPEEARANDLRDAERFEAFKASNGGVVPGQERPYKRRRRKPKGGFEGRKTQVLGKGTKR